MFKSTVTEMSLNVLTGILMVLLHCPTQLDLRPRCGNCLDKLDPPRSLSQRGDAEGKVRFSLLRKSPGLKQPGTGTENTAQTLILKGPRPAVRTQVTGNAHRSHVRVSEEGGLPAECSSRGFAAREHPRTPNVLRQGGEQCYCIQHWPGHNCTSVSTHWLTKQILIPAQVLRDGEGNHPCAHTGSFKSSGKNRQQTQRCICLHK